MPANFVHLHTHSHYSLLDGLSKIDDLIKKCLEYDMPAMALTDHGNMYGAIEFYKKATAAGIKPIIGVEAYMAVRSRFQKEANIDSKRFHLTLLAKNETGYRNLMRLVSKSYLEGYYYKPRMDRELLKEHSDGLICLSGCMGSELSRLIWNKHYDEAKKLALDYQEIFGKGNYFIEIMHHPKIERQLEIKADLIKLAHELDIPLVATYDSHYINKDDKDAHNTLVAIQSNTDVSDTKRFNNPDEDFSFISPAEAEMLYADAPESITNTIKIADMCELNLNLGKWTFPNFEIPKGSSYDNELRKKAEEGLANYLAEHPEIDPKEPTERMNYELEVIKAKGYSPYFLVVSDLINFARSQKIFNNTRGSAAGSFVSFLIKITDVDPLFYKLPFERFLNPDRPSAPDIDMDYADKRRDEIINYARRKYGEDHVAQIGTFGSMLARSSVRDVARALGYPYAVGDRIANMIPLGSQGFPMTIKRAMEIVPELKEDYEKSADTKKIIDLALKIEGCARHISVHAAGVVISPTPITDFVPIQLDPKGGKTITQYDMHAVEDAGLLKFDFLGIRNLSILEDSIRIVHKTRGIEIDIQKIPLDDKKTFEMLSRGETYGLFQLGGAGMTRWLKELKPSTIFDINAMVALYRPGPMESIPEYIKRKHNPKAIKYLDPRMKEILEQSFGVITYQDDVMLIAIKLAGYSWVEADKLRKAMGKKIPEVMQAEKEKLIAGLAKHGMEEKKIKKLWSLIEPFAAYGFNKAHAASYGRVAYQTAYMKANYPAEYMTAVLSAESGNTEEIAAIINECKNMGIPVLPPDVNESFGDFTVVKSGSEFAKEIGSNDGIDKIRFGLYTIKNLGTEIADAIVEERKRGGPYTSYVNFLDRVTHKNMNRKSLESLIKAGALDSLGEDRGVMIANLEESVAYNLEAKKGRTSQSSLFGIMEDKSTVPQLKLKPGNQISRKEKLKWEKELLGLYVSGHPLDEYRDRFSQATLNIKAARELEDGKPVILGGIIEELKEIMTKSNTKMAFGKLADFDGRIEIVFFPSILDKFRAIIANDKCIAIRGKISRRNGEPSVIVDSLKELV